jgi:hypothetical protein
VELETEKAKNVNLNNQLTPYKRINDELGFLRSSMNRALQNTENFTKVQLDARYKLFHEESNEHAMLCLAAINKIELDEVKVAFSRILAAERRRITSMTEELQWLIKKALMKDFATRSALVCVFLAILYQLLIVL